MNESKKRQPISLWKSISIAVCAVLLSGAAYGQSKIALSLPLTNAPGSTAMPSDATGGGANISVGMFNGANVASDFHGLPGSGVNGSLSGVRAMCFTNGAGTTQPANNSAASDYAQDASDAALGFGSVSNFVITMWVNQFAKMPPAGNIGPRLFILGGGGVAGDTSTANTIGVKFQGTAQMYLSINTGNPTLGPALSADVPANKWVFVAWAYDGTNAYEYYGSDTASAQLVGQASAPGQVVNFGSAGSLILGNRGTGKIRGFNGWMQDFRFYTNVATTANNTGVFVENIRQRLAPLPSVQNVYPDGTSLMQATDTFSFTVASPTGVNITNVNLTMNGADVSSQLEFVTNGTPGSSTNVSVSFTGLTFNRMTNAAVISLRDANGLANVYNASLFDTFYPTNFLVEAEEFDFNGGNFIDNPDYTDGDPADAHSYFGLDSYEGIDSHKGVSTGANVTDYRADPGDGSRPQTPVATGEQTSPKFAGLVDADSNPVVPHMLGNWSSAEWQNYTKTFPSGLFNVYARASTASGATIKFDQVISGRGSSSQTTSPLGTFTFSGTSSSAFGWVPLRDGLGNLAILNLAGVNTVRATTGGGANLDFFLFVPANTNLPTISNVYPNGQVLFQATNKMAFTVASAVATIDTSKIQLVLNGVDVSSSLIFSGGPSTWNVTYAGLQANQSYSATISVADALNNTASGSLKFDTWNPVFQVEAEDFDFNGGQYIDNPTPTLGTAGDSYFGKVGVVGIDEFNQNAVPPYAGASSDNYRATDPTATTRVTDATRAQFKATGAYDYNVGFLGPGFWQNYTKTWPTGTYNIYIRMASGANLGNLHASWSKVIDGWGTTNQITRHIGTFTIPSTNGYSSYLYAPLIDKYGNYANVTLGGTDTFRCTELTQDQSDLLAAATYGLNVNFFMLLNARADLPRVDGIYPDGTVLDQQTNALTFVASSPVYGLATNNIHLTLNGVDVSSGLIFSGGPGGVWNVSYPKLSMNTFYTAVITMTDNNNQAHTTTVNFDTFSSNNYTWEAEDWDFDPAYSPISDGSGLRFIDNPIPTSVPATNSYFGQTGDGSQISGNPIDYSSLFGLTHPGTYNYRPYDYVSAEVTSDAPRLKYLTAQLANNDGNIVDRDVNFWATNGWINYTRTFPSGTYYLYARLSAGAVPYTLQCAQVTSGAGSGTQASNYLGSFTGTGTGFGNWSYVPLVNTNTSQRVQLTLGGVSTFTFTGDYNEDVNFFMLVPLPPAPVSLAAAINGANVQLSFPTKASVTYIIEFKDSLSDATWTFLASVPGDGTVQSHSDGLTATSRFYRLRIQ